MQNPFADNALELAGVQHILQMFWKSQHLSALQPWRVSDTSSRVLHLSVVVEINGFLRFWTFVDSGSFPSHNTLSYTVFQLLCVDLGWRVVELLCAVMLPATTSPKTSKKSPRERILIGSKNGVISVNMNVQCVRQSVSEENEFLAVDI